MTKRGFAILVMLLTTLISARLIIDIEAGKYSTTSMTIDGHNIVTYTDRYKNSDDFAFWYKDCASHDRSLEIIDDTEYYYESNICESVSWNFPSDEYFVDIETERTFKNKHEYVTIREYLEDFYVGTATPDLFSQMDIVETKEAKYVLTGKKITPDMESFDIRRYSDSYLADNVSCMDTYQMILFENDTHEYVYTYKSCDEDDTEHAIFRGYGDGDIAAYTNTPIFIDIDNFVDSNRDFITLCDIEKTGLGFTRQKADTYNIPVATSCSY